MRLIDANEFRERIDHYPPDIRDIAKKELRYVKTIDAEVVVRCKDCEYYNGEYQYCVNDIYAKPNGYCSYGEEI